MKMGFMKNTFSKLQSKAEEAMLRRLKTQTKKAFRRQLLLVMKINTSFYV